LLKTIAKVLIQKDYRDFLRWYKNRFGSSSVIGAYINLLRNRGIGFVPTDIAGVSVFLRLGTADLDVFDQIFISKDYNLELGDPQFIVDAGAHIGLSSVYFASKWPKATIIAIEPEPSNFEILLMNTRIFPNINPLQAGLWSKKTNLRIQDSNAETWSFCVSESQTGEGIPAVGIKDIIADFRLPKIDVLKMDIEGSELEVLSCNNSWIDNVRNLIIELHDRFQPGCSKALEDAFSNYDYCKAISGENIVFTKISRLNT